MTDLSEQLREDGNSPEYNSYAFDPRPLFREAAAALDAQDAEIKKQADHFHEVISGLYLQIETREALLAEAEQALAAVEGWWLEDEMAKHVGAPYAIFTTRTILAKLKARSVSGAPSSIPADQSDARNRGGADPVEQN